MQSRMKESSRKGVANRLASSLAAAVARLPSKRAVAQSLCPSNSAALHRIHGKAAEFLDRETQRYAFLGQCGYAQGFLAKCRSFGPKEPALRMTVRYVGAPNGIAPKMYKLRAEFEGHKLCTTAGFDGRLATAFARLEARRFATPFL